MKITVPAVEFLRASELALTVTAKAALSATSVLDKIRLTVGVHSNLFVQGTDGHRGMSVELMGTDSEPGECLIDPRMLIGLLSEYQDEHFTFQTIGNQIDLGGVIQAPILPTQGFPDIPDWDEVTVAIEAATKLRNAIAAVLPAVGDSDTSTHGAISNLAIETLDGGGVKCVALDSTRVAVYPVQFTTLTDRGQIHLLPGSAAKVLAHLCNSTLPVTLSCRPNGIMARVGRRRAWFSLREGGFPPYEKIIPPSHITKGKFKSSDFALKLRLAGLVLGRDGGRVELIVQTTATGSGTMTIKAEHQGRYYADKVELADFSPPPNDGMRVSFSQRNLLEFAEWAAKNGVDASFYISHNPRNGQMAAGWQCGLLSYITAPITEKS